MPESLFLFIPLLPLLGFLINGVGFRALSKGLSGLVGCAAALASFAVTAYAFSVFNASVKAKGPATAIIVQVYEWFSVAGLKVGLSFQIDQLSLLMLLIITGVGSLIHIYSVGYMKKDPGFAKFFAYLNLFLFFMILLVMGSNYLVMFIGWEGVGLCSYLLIGFWNKSTAYNNAARKAFIMNRVGDLGFLLGIFTMIGAFGSVEFSEVFQKAASLTIGDPILVAIALLLFVGAVGKSAQIPLYTWLPDAMAGPTPVSALIHAATMVTAGVYMVIRSNLLYTMAPVSLEVVAIIGTATALLGASIGLYQTDIKKVLAYSTVSQLGYMFMALGVAAFSSSFFHVMTHAFFKALLFLGAGSVIHAMSNEQDIRFMGGLRKKLPVTFLTFSVGAWAISGLPPFSGFFSKDEILAHVFEKNKVLWTLGLLTSAMTAFYMFRLVFLTFFGEFRGSREQEKHLHESPASMTIPLILLAILAALGGLLNIPKVLHGGEWLMNYMSPLFAAGRQVNPEAYAALGLSHSTEYLLMGLSVAIALVAAIVAYIIFVRNARIPAAETTPRHGLEKWVYHKYYIDELYDVVFVRSIRGLSDLLWSFGEFTVDLMVYTAGALTTVFSKSLRKLQTGSIGYYLFAMVIGVVVILVWNLMKNKF